MSSAAPSMTLYGPVSPISAAMSRPRTVVSGPTLESPLTTVTRGSRGGEPTSVVSSCVDDDGEQEHQTEHPEGRSDCSDAPVDARRVGRWELRRRELRRLLADLRPVLEQRAVASVGERHRGSCVGADVRREGRDRDGGWLGRSCVGANVRARNARLRRSRVGTDVDEIVRRRNEDWIQRSSIGTNVRARHDRLQRSRVCADVRRLESGDCERGVEIVRVEAGAASALVRWRSSSSPVRSARRLPRRRGQGRGVRRVGGSP